MIDHMGVQVADVEASLAFYLRAFAPIGMREAMRFPVGAEVLHAPGVARAPGNYGASCAIPTAATWRPCTRPLGRAC